MFLKYQGNVFKIFDYDRKSKWAVRAARKTNYHRFYSLKFTEKYDI